MSKTTQEVAADILIAWMQHLPSSMPKGDWHAETQKIAEAYKKIFAAVLNPSA